MFLRRGPRNDGKGLQSPEWWLSSPGLRSKCDRRGIVLPKWSCGRRAGVLTSTGRNPRERSQLFRTSVRVVAQGPFSGKLRLTGKKTVPESVLAAFAKTAEHSLGSSFSPQLCVLGRLRKFLPVLFISSIKDWTHSGAALSAPGVGE